MSSPSDNEDSDPDFEDDLESLDSSEEEAIHEEESEKEEDVEEESEGGGSESEEEEDVEEESKEGGSESKEDAEFDFIFEKKLVGADFAEGLLISKEKRDNHFPRGQNVFLEVHDLERAKSMQWKVTRVQEGLLFTQGWITYTDDQGLEEGDFLWFYRRASTKSDLGFQFAVEYKRLAASNEDRHLEFLFEMQISYEDFVQQRLCIPWTHVEEFFPPRLVKKQKQKRLNIIISDDFRNDWPIEMEVRYNEEDYKFQIGWMIFATDKNLKQNDRVAFFNHPDRTSPYHFLVRDSKLSTKISAILNEHNPDLIFNCGVNLILEKELLSSDVGGKYPKLIIPHEVAEEHFPPLERPKEGYRMFFLNAFCVRFSMRYKFIQCTESYAIVGSAWREFVKEYELRVDGRIQFLKFSKDDQETDLFINFVEKLEQLETVCLKIETLHRV